MGVYIFNFRLGEYVVGLLFLLFHFFLIKEKNRILRYIYLSFLLFSILNFY